MKPTNLRTTTDSRSCANCLLYKPLKENKDFHDQFRLDPPQVTAYGNEADFKAHDGNCEAFSNTPVLKTQICDGYIPL